MTSPSRHGTCCEPECGRFDARDAAYLVVYSCVIYAAEEALHKEEIAARCSRLATAVLPGRISPPHLLHREQSMGILIAVLNSVAVVQKAKSLNTNCGLGAYEVVRSHRHVWPSSLARWLDDTHYFRQYAV